MDSRFKLPGHDQHTSIMGQTGSGKTVMGAKILSHGDFHNRVHVIVDYKRDTLLNSIEKAEEIDLKKFPHHPGLYIVHPYPGQDDDVENFLWQAWRAENNTLLFDEAYMIPDIQAYPTLLTQGRSKKIQTINLTQRPAWISRFVFSESTFFNIFYLNDRDDRKKVQRFIPKEKGGDIDRRLDKYHSWWYDVHEDSLFHLKPAESSDTILQRFDDNIKPKRKFFSFM